VVQPVISEPVAPPVVQPVISEPVAPPVVQPVISEPVAPPVVTPPVSGLFSSEEYEYEYVVPEDGGGAGFEEGGSSREYEAPWERQEDEGEYDGFKAEEYEPFREVERDAAGYSDGGDRDRGGQFDPESEYASAEDPSGYGRQERGYDEYDEYDEYESETSFEEELRQSGDDEEERLREQGREEEAALREEEYEVREALRAEARRFGGSPSGVEAAGRSDGDGAGSMAADGPGIKGGAAVDEELELELSAMGLVQGLFSLSTLVGIGLCCFIVFAAVFYIRRSKGLPLFEHPDAASGDSVATELEKADRVPLTGGASGSAARDTQEDFGDLDEGEAWSEDDGWGDDEPAGTSKPANCTVEMNRISNSISSTLQTSADKKSRALAATVISEREEPPRAASLAIDGGRCSSSRDARSRDQERETLPPPRPSRSLSISSLRPKPKPKPKPKKKPAKKLAFPTVAPVDIFKDFGMMAAPTFSGKKSAAKPAAPAPAPAVSSRWQMDVLPSDDEDLDSGGGWDDDDDDDAL